jgi:hypothetical protein
MSLIERIQQHAAVRVVEEAAREEQIKHAKLVRVEKDKAALIECLTMRLPGLLEEVTCDWFPHIPYNPQEDIGFWCKLWISFGEKRIQILGSWAVLTLCHPGSGRTCPVALGNDTDANWKDFIKAVAYVTGAYFDAQQRLGLPTVEVRKPRGLR